MPLRSGGNDRRGYCSSGNTPQCQCGCRHDAHVFWVPVKKSVMASFFGMDVRNIFMAKLKISGKILGSIKRVADDWVTGGRYGGMSVGSKTHCVVYKDSLCKNKTKNM